VDAVAVVLGDRGGVLHVEGDGGGVTPAHAVADGVGVGRGAGEAGLGGEAQAAVEALGEAADEAGGVDAEDGECVTIGVGVAVEHARGGEFEGLAGAQGVGVVVGDRGGVATAGREHAEGDAGDGGVSAVFVGEADGDGGGAGGGVEVGEVAHAAGGAGAAVAPVDGDAVGQQAVLAGVEVVGEVEGVGDADRGAGCAAGGKGGATLSMVTAWVPRVKLPSSSVVLTVMALPGPSA
jgi:hypothetical protein